MPPITANGQFNSDLGAQLYQVAKLMQPNTPMRGNRQFFFVQMDGFDTHMNQISIGPSAGRHAAPLLQLGQATATYKRR